jgi:hypothetical protein
MPVSSSQASRPQADSQERCTVLEEALHLSDVSVSGVKDLINRIVYRLEDSLQGAPEYFT